MQIHLEIQSPQNLSRVKPDQTELKDKEDSSKALLLQPWMAKQASSNNSPPDIMQSSPQSITPYVGIIIFHCISCRAESLFSWGKKAPKLLNQTKKNPNSLLQTPIPNPTACSSLSWCRNSNGSCPFACPNWGALVPPESGL